MIYGLAYRFGSRHPEQGYHVLPSAFYNALADPGRPVVAVNLDHAVPLASERDRLRLWVEDGVGLAFSVIGTDLPARAAGCSFAMKADPLQDGARAFSRIVLEDVALVRTTRTPLLTGTFCTDDPQAWAAFLSASRAGTYRGPSVARRPGSKPTRHARTVRATTSDVMYFASQLHETAALAAIPLATRARRPSPID